MHVSVITSYSAMSLFMLECSMHCSLHRSFSTLLGSTYGMLVCICSAILYYKSAKRRHDVGYNSVSLRCRLSCCRLPHCRHTVSQTLVTSKGHRHTHRHTPSGSHFSIYSRKKSSPHANLAVKVTFPHKA